MNPMLVDVMSQPGRVASDTKVAPPLSSRSPHELDCTHWLRVEHRGPTREASSLGLFRFFFLTTPLRHLVLRAF